jgi:hypothetical protein
MTRDPFLDDLADLLRSQYGLDASNIPFPIDPPSAQAAAEARAKAFLNDPPAKIDTPEVVKARDLEVERIKEDPERLGDQRESLLRELNEADADVADAKAAAGCATSGESL